MPGLGQGGGEPLALQLLPAVQDLAQRQWGMRTVAYLSTGSVQVPAARHLSAAMRCCWLTACICLERHLSSAEHPSRHHAPGCSPLTGLTGSEGLHAALWL